MKVLIGSTLLVFFALSLAWAQAPRDQNPFDGAPRVKKDPAGFRQWVDVSRGFTIKAKLAGTADDKVKLLKEDGSVLTISPEKLSDEDRQWIKDKQVEKKSKLDAKRKEHTSWVAKAVGIRPVMIDDPTSYITLDANGVSGGVVHNYYQATERYYYWQPVTGELRSYQKSDVVISTPQSGTYGDQTPTQGMTFKYNNLGKADQKFLDEYRKMEKELDGSQ